MSLPKVGGRDTEHVDLVVALGTRASAAGVTLSDTSPEPWIARLPPLTVLTCLAEVTDEKGEAEISRNWSFAVAAGDIIHYNWPLSAFGNNQYHLKLHAPNGFYREFKGSDSDPSPVISCEYEKHPGAGKPTGNLLMKIINTDQRRSYTVSIIDNAYKSPSMLREVLKNTTSNFVLKLQKSFGWYDFSLKIKGFDNFEKRYAGRVETGRESFSDPYMGRVI